jgi:hypothetical protein
VSLQESDFLCVAGPLQPSYGNRDRIGGKTTFSSGVLQETEK